MTLYLSGPMTGKPDGNRAAFSLAESALQAAGFGVVNPHHLPAPALTGDAETDWESWLAADLAVIASGAVDALALLDGWSGSRGARLERGMALELGLPCKTVEAWLTHAEDESNGQ